MGKSAQIVKRKVHISIKQLKVISGPVNEANCFNGRELITANEAASFSQRRAKGIWLNAGKCLHVKNTQCHPALVIAAVLALRVGMGTEGCALY